MRELFFAYLSTRRAFRDADRCRKTLVGAMRRYLAAHDGRGFTDWESLPPEAATRAALLIADRAEAALQLADFCRRCGRCPESRILR